MKSKTIKREMNESFPRAEPFPAKDTHSTSTARGHRQHTRTLRAQRGSEDHAKPRHNTRKVCACVNVTET